jgi:tRNA-dihydrouridine synthase A
VEAALLDYMAALEAAGTPWPHASRHMLGLHNGQPGARRWRQVWSDSVARREAVRAVADRATAARLAMVAGLLRAA